jgi:hypothetical protein
VAERFDNLPGRILLAKDGTSLLDAAIHPGGYPPVFIAKAADRPPPAILDEGRLVQLPSRLPLARDCLRRKPPSSRLLRAPAVSHDPIAAEQVRR